MNEDYLMHYGVLGMKWGIRKDRTRSGKEKSRIVYEDEHGNEKKASPIVGATILRAMGKAGKVNARQDAYDRAVSNKEIDRDERYEKKLLDQKAKSQRSINKAFKHLEFEAYMRSDAGKQKMKDVAKQTAMMTAGRIAIGMTLGAIGATGMISLGNLYRPSYTPDTFSRPYDLPEMPDIDDPTRGKRIYIT